MKKSNENPSLNCDDVERLLIHRIFDQLTPEVNLSVEKHLKSCDRCQSYQKTLLNLQNSIQIRAEEKLVPDPAIRQNIIQRMKTLEPQEAGFLRSTWQYVRSIFALHLLRISARSICSCSVKSCLSMPPRDTADRKIRDSGHRDFNTAISRC